MKKLCALILAAIIAMPVLAVAEEAAAPAAAEAGFNLGERKKIEEWNKSLQSMYENKAYKENCGSELPITIDDSMVRPSMEKRKNPAAYCNAVRGVIAGMCGKDATSKEAIAAKIKSLTCAYKEGEKDSMSLSADGVLSVGTGDVDTSNLSRSVPEYLDKNL